MSATVRDVMTTSVVAVRKDASFKEMAAIMTAPAITTSPDATVEQAARLMYDRRVKRLPVVNASGRLPGIISRVDVLAVYSRPDQDIQDEVAQAVLPGILPGSAKKLHVAVREGIVTITGDPQTEQTAKAVIDAVRHVQGVVAVRDRFS